MLEVEGSAWARWRQTDLGERSPERPSAERATPDERPAGVAERQCRLDGEIGQAGAPIIGESSPSPGT